MGLLGTLAPTCLDPDQLMPVPPGPRALQHVQVCSSTPELRKRSIPGTVFGWGEDVCGAIVKTGVRGGGKGRGREEGKGEDGE